MERRNYEMIAFHVIICQYFKGTRGLAPLSIIPIANRSKAKFSIIKTLVSLTGTRPGASMNTIKKGGCK